jgi:hypothetical protein
VLPHTPKILPTSLLERVLLILFLTFPTAPCFLLRGQDLDSTIKEEARLNRRLEILYALGQEKKTYLVFHFPKKAIECHLRGMRMRSLPMRDMLLLGRLPANYSALILRIKETDRPPQRDVIDPQKALESKEETASTTTTSTLPPGAEFSLPDYNNPEFLELREMPTRYNLFFDTGFAVMIRPEEAPAEAKGFFTQRWQQFSIWWSDAKARMNRRLGKEQVPQLRLTLSEEDCRVLFWVISEGGKVLFITQDS